MSELQRSFAKSKLAKFPVAPPRPQLSSLQGMDDVEDESEGIAPLPQETKADGTLAVPTTAEDDSSSASSASSTGTIKPEPKRGRFAKPQR